MSGRLDNSRFAPGADAGPPHHDFAGTLVVPEIAMTALRFAHDKGKDETYDVLACARITDAIKPF
ncbi:MAG: hypothetical protein VYA71_04235 [Pseudomonadota bacterium]|nr:hypothetical protein [Pseudomonadota bacterium]